MIKKFCEWQTKCVEDTDDTWTCCAHLHEGRANTCPYDSLAQAKRGQYPCVDGEPPEVPDGCLGVSKEEKE